MPGRVTFQHPALQSIPLPDREKQPEIKRHLPAMRIDTFPARCSGLGLRWGIRSPRTARDLRCSWVSAASFSFAVADRGDGVPDRQTLNLYPRPFVSPGLQR